MKGLAIVPLALVAATPEPPLVRAAGGQALCLPAPQRTTPRNLYEPADRWRRDQRTIA